jgi:integrase
LDGACEKNALPVYSQPHLLRHTFATHAVQVEKIPIDIVGQWLKQKNLDVTDYYSQPTESMVAEAADRYLSRVAVAIHVHKAVQCSPQELQKLYHEARGSRHAGRGDLGELY